MKPRRRVVSEWSKISRSVFPGAVRSPLPRIWPEDFTLGRPSQEMQRTSQSTPVVSTPTLQITGIEPSWNARFSARRSDGSGQRVHVAGVDPAAMKLLLEVLAWARSTANTSVGRLSALASQVVTTSATSSRLSIAFDRSPSW